MKKLLSFAFALVAMCGMTYADTLDGGAVATPEAPRASGVTNASNDAQDVPEIKAGLEALQRNDIEGALAKFEEARKTHPEYSPAELMLAKLALQINPQSNGSAARMLIERCVKNNPTDPEAFIFLADYNLGNGSVTEAELLFREARRLLEKFNGNAQRKSAMIRQLNQGMAIVFEHRGQFEQAKVFLESLLKSDPKNIDAMQQLGRLYLNMERPEDAIRMFTQAKSINKDILTPEAIVALYYQQKGDKATATTYMTKALQKAPNDLNTCLAAAQWFQQNEAMPRAVQLADQALQIDPNSEAAMLLRGNFALIQKDYPKAIEMFNKVLTKSPSNFAASNNLALALCEPGKKTKEVADADLKKAIEYAGVNAQRFGREPAAFSTLGYVLLKAGNVDQALQALQQSLQLSGGRMSADTAYYLCAALKAKGNPDGIKQAKEIIDQNLKANKTFMMRPEAEALKVELDKLVPAAPAAVAPAAPATPTAPATPARVAPATR